MSGVALSFAAGCLAVAGAAEIGRALGPALERAAPRVGRGAGGLVESLLRVGREGRDPGAVERRRLLTAGAGLAFALGTFMLGPLAGMLLAASGPWVVARVLRARRERYRAAVDAGAASIAIALADALGGGHSLRGAVVQAASGVGGPPGRELGRTATELALGAPTEDALDAMRDRARSHGIDTIVAAALLQRRAGGDLAGLLREVARALEDQSRLDGEVRAATAQARFTGLIVVLLPVGGALLAELASPGYLRDLSGSFLTAWLAGLALIMQLVAAVAIRRLGRVRS